MITPKVQKFAKVLFSLHQQGLLNDPEFRPVVGALVREAMETPHAHSTTDYRSHGAAAAIAKFAPKTKAQYHSWCRSELRHEHMVPTSVRIDILLNEPDLTEDFIARSLQKYGLRATILKTEDEVLNKAHLKAKMPDSFRSPESPLYMHPLARYIETGLEKKLVARQGACWFTDNQQTPSD